MQYQADDFLAAVLHRSVWTVKGVKAGSEADIQQWLKDTKPEFVSAKTDVRDTKVGDELRELGFVLADELVMLEKPRAASLAPQAQGYTLRWATIDDEAKVVAVARRAFRCSRFHTDPAFSAEEADNLKGAWAGNFWRGTRGDGMAIAANASGAVGFLLVLIKNQTLFLDLLAVDERHRGRGLGKALVQWTEAEWKKSPVTTLSVGTQARNVPALALYKACGFTESGRRQVWHWHAPRAQSKVKL